MPTDLLNFSLVIYLLCYFLTFFYLNYLVNVCFNNKNRKFVIFPKEKNENEKKLQCVWRVKIFAKENVILMIFIEIC